MLHQGDQSVRYHGYIVDLLDRICQMLGLKYDLLPVEDGEYGQQGVDGTWNGMIRELLEKVGRSLNIGFEIILNYKVVNLFFL